MPPTGSPHEPSVSGSCGGRTSKGAERGLAEPGGPRRADFARTRRSVTTASQTSYPSSPRKRGASLIALLRLSPTEPAYPQGARRIRKAAEPLTAAQVLGFGGAPLDAEACCTRRGRCPHRPCWRGTLRGVTFCSPRKSPKRRSGGGFRIPPPENHPPPTKRVAASCIAFASA